MPGIFNRYQVTKEINICDNEVIQKFSSPEEIDRLKKEMKCVRYKKGEMIFHERQPVYLIYFINSGQIKLWKEGVHNEEHIVYFALTGELIGFWGCLEGKEYSLSATTLQESYVSFISKETFFQIIGSNYKLQFELLRDYTRTTKKTEVLLRNMAEMNVREKIAFSLLNLEQIFGSCENNNTIKTEINRELISTLSGVSIDRVSKQISEFKDELIIWTKGKSTAIDKKKLRSIITPYVMLDF